MPPSRSLAKQVQETFQRNAPFAGVGVAIGLIVWHFLFPLPLGLASFVVTRSHPNFGHLLGFLSRLSVVPGIIWVGTSVWGAQWRKGIPLVPVSMKGLFWTMLCVLSFLPVELSFLLTVSQTLGLPDVPDPVFSAGMLGTILGAPIAEEILFRGYGLARIRELGGNRKALFLTAIVFALLHGSWDRVPGSFAMGLFLAWLVLRTGSLWPAFLGHVTHNGAIVAMSQLGGPSIDLAKNVPWQTVLSLGCSGLACLALLGSPLIRSRIKELSHTPS